MSIPTMISLPKNVLINLGIRSAENVHYQLSPEELTEQTVYRKEGILSDTGALTINTGEFTGR
ncbi:MAG TPA: phosphoenolpyruvate carboxykinase (ATP), partial [Chitinophagaceae bacterium]|nr:phosphoenolpyruvate carboxykinase (ATP) [Chitinophagaceae bacterium]